MIFKRPYGRLGKLTRHKWKQHLYSNKGLFRRRKPPGYVKGPTVTESGEIIGDQLTMEVTAFYHVASDEQQEFLEELQKDNEEAAYEYMLVITEAINIWKKDILALRYALKYLEREQNDLQEKEKHLEAANREDILGRLPETLQRRFPGLFQIDSLQQLENQDETIAHIKNVEQDLRKHEHKLKQYLEELEDRLPFLFS